MGCCCSKSKRPDEIKKIPALALEDTGIPKIDDGWAKIGKMHRTLESDSNDLYEVVETLIEKSGTDEIPQEDITASLRSQMATWKSILDPKQLQAIPNLLLDIPSLQNLDPTISAVLDLTKVFPKLEDPSFETMQKVIEKLLALAEKQLQNLICIATAASTLALTLADPELAAEKVATGAEEAATEGIEVLMAGGGMSAAKAMWNNMKALRQFQHSLETLVNNIRVIVRAIMDAFSSKSTTAPKKLDAKRSKKLQEAVKHFKTKSEQVAVVAKAEKMTPYKLSAEELQMLSDMVECSLFETTVAAVIRAKAPDATGFYCDACCSDLDPDARILGCKKCKESGGWFGGGSSCDVGICVRCSSLMLAHASKDVPLTKKEVKAVGEKVGYKLMKAYCFYDTERLCNECEQQFSEGDFFLSSKDPSDNYDICCQCSHKKLGKA